MSTDSSIGNSSKCAVCAKVCTPPLNICPKCKLPCHSKCAGRRLNYSCDLCRNQKKPLNKPGNILVTNKSRNISATNTARKTQPVPSRSKGSSLLNTTDVFVRPKGTSTPAMRKNNSCSSSVSGSSSASGSIPDSAIQTDIPSKSADQTAAKQKPTVTETNTQAGAQVVTLQRRGGDKDLSDGRVAVSQASISQLDTNKFSALNVTPATPSVITDERLANLTGVTNVLIPVTTLEFFFQRFDSIEMQLDNLKSRDTRSFSSSSVPAVPVETDSPAGGDLATKISALEKTILDQNNLLVDLNNKCKLLLEENTALKAALNKMHDRACRQNNHSGGLTAPEDVEKSGNLSDISKHLTQSKILESNVSSREIIISNIYEGTDKDSSDVIHAILSTILPTIQKNDITSVRLLRSNGKPKAGSAGKQPTLVRNAWVVQLADSGLIKDVMYAKHKFTRLCTRDINVTGLRQEVIDNISNSKIFINEMLSKDKFIQFKSLKAVARGLKFKYFWHRGGRFLAKFRDGVASQLIKTAADLQAIAMSLGATKQKSSDSINHNGINKSLDSKVEEATANDRVINAAS